MKDTIWIYAAIILWVSETWSMEQGTNQSTSVNSNTRVYVAKSSTFNLGSEIKLNCSNKTWSEMMYVIWKINLKNKTCKIAFNNDGQSQNNCSDGKTLKNTSDSQSYLYIPNFSNDDLGIYTCESVYSGGNENYVINVSITVAPISAVWLEHKDNKIIAVCKAERGKPAATISWSHIGNSTFEIQHSTQDSDGFFTVESRLELLEGLNKKNLSCVIRHQSWEKDVILELKLSYFPWLCIPIVAVVFALLVVFLIFAQKKLVMLRQCRQSDNSPSKSSPTEDVEEVQPYASYVQRENSIYNSSANAHASHAYN